MVYPDQQNLNTMKKNKRIIDIGKDFSRFPAGRFLSDGPNNGEKFQINFLIPVMKKDEPVIIELDNTAGYGSSFLEEAFGGLIRKGYSAEQIHRCLSFSTQDPSLIAEINSYIDEASQESLS